jgi:hypothetical protein
MTGGRSEELNRSLAYLVEALVTELELDSRSLGSATFRREDLDRGFEPDSCFYIQNASRVAGKKKLDLTIDPPPDNLGVPEVWRCSGNAVRILRFVSGRYEESPSSLAFPFLTAEKLSELLSQGRNVRRSQWIRTLRRWLDSARSKDA